MRTASWASVTSRCSSTTCSQPVSEAAPFRHVAVELDKKIKKSVVNVLCSSKIGCIFAADFAAHVLLAMMLMR